MNAAERPDRARLLFGKGFSLSPTTQQIYIARSLLKLSAGEDAGSKTKAAEILVANAQGISRF